MFIRLVSAIEGLLESHSPPLSLYCKLQQKEEGFFARQKSRFAWHHGFKRSDATEKRDVEIKGQATGEISKKLRNLLDMIDFRCNPFVFLQGLRKLV